MKQHRIFATRASTLRARFTAALRPIALPVLIVVSASACAAPIPNTPPTDALAARFALADARRARTLAPDLYARAERAHDDAQHSDDDAARRDCEERAQLSLEAAVAEADRIGDERDGAASDARAEQLIEQRAALERQRLDLEQSVARELAARAALDEAARVLQSATPSRADTDKTRDQAAAFVRERAALTLAAAIAFGLDNARADALEHAIARAEHAPSSGARVSAAKRVLEQAQQSLDAARAARAQ